jgi:6-pyruvoyltetrahydropterin/6-carboxytetrahydropterin synthase
MYYLEKRFSIPIGHRLSKHKGLCKNIHGHNIIVMVGVKSDTLNEDDMVIDFSSLKALVAGFLETLDHVLLINKNDTELCSKIESIFPEMRIIAIEGDPTAENLSRQFYTHLKKGLNSMYPDVEMDYVAIYENENSKVTYKE